MGVQQHTKIIYIKISSEVTNMSTFLLNQEGILSLHSHRHIWLSLHRIVIITESQIHHHSCCHHILIIDHRSVLSVISSFYKVIPLSTRCRPSPHPCLHHISRNPSCRNSLGPSLHCHGNNLHLLPSFYRTQIIYFSLCTSRQRKKLQMQTTCVLSPQQ